jgi:glycosyltransferase involved in cell wall biosynthesis
MEALATVIVPCLNNASTIAKNLNSINAQDVRPQLRVVVIDNGSTDDSIGIARSLADEVMVEKTPGSAAARNTGIFAAQTEYYLSIDADCWPADDRWASRHLAAMQSADSTVIGSAGQIIAAPTRDYWGQRADVTPHPAFSGSEPLYAVTANACYRTGLVKKLGGFPQYLAEDAAFGRVSRGRGLRFLWLPEAKVFHHNPQGLTGYYLQMKKIGLYVAELDGPPRSRTRFLANRLRELLANAKWLARRKPTEALAGVARVVAQTEGALRYWY